MKNICVSMSLSETALDSYLIRVFDGELFERKTCKIVYFPEENLLQKPIWTIIRFKSFCDSVVENKSALRLYKAKITKTL